MGCPGADATARRRSLGIPQLRVIARIEGNRGFKPAPILPVRRHLWSAGRKTLVQGVLCS